MLSLLIAHYFAACLPLVLAGIGTGFGQGILGFGTLDSIAIQDLGRDKSVRAMIIGLALTESSVVIALVMTLMTLWREGTSLSWPIIFGEFGIALAIGISGLLVTIASGFAVRSACRSIMRQPFQAQKILTFMFIIQSLIEAAFIFSFVIALMIRGNIVESLDLYNGLKFLAAGLAMGLGAIGPLIGQAIFSNVACKAVGVGGGSYNKIVSFSLLSEAALEAPLLFALVIAILIFYFPLPFEGELLKVVAFFVAAITISLGTFGGGWASSRVSSKGCIVVALNPEIYPTLLKSAFLAQAFIESIVVYSLLISMFLITT